MGPFSVGQRGIGSYVEPSPIAPSIAAAVTPIGVLQAVGSGGWNVRPPRADAPANRVVVIVEAPSTLPACLRSDNRELTLPLDLQRQAVHGGDSRPLPLRDLLARMSVPQLSVESHPS